MRQNSTFVAKAICFIILTISLNKAVAQCTSPSLTFVNPVLSSGNAGQEGAEYKFTNVTAGINAFIKIKKIKDGASLVSIDTFYAGSGGGYNAAWQPVVDGPTYPAGNKSYIEWEIRFKTSGGSDYTYPCLDMSAIDIDGDNVRIREFVESKDYASYNTPNGSVLTFLDNLLDILSPGKEGKGPVANRPSIDTTSLDVRVNFKYSNKNKIRITTGAYVDNTSASGSPSTDRFSSLYFKKISNGTTTTLPVTYTSFNAIVSDRSVMLNWATAFELNNNHFEVERSFDRNVFNTIGIVLDAYSTVGSVKSYQMKDNSVELQGKTVVYYRLKQVDIDGRETYSTILAVRMQAKSGVQVQVSPNPFAEKLIVRFNSTENANAEIRLIDMTGKTQLSKQFSVSKGFNNITLENLGRIGTGVYVAQVFVNGVVLDKQKVVKE